MKDAEEITTREGIVIHKEVVQYILDHPGDYRVCTSCGCPEIHPLSEVGAKTSSSGYYKPDILAYVDGHKLYISGTLYYSKLRHITQEFLGYPGDCIMHKK